MKSIFEILKLNQISDISAKTKDDVLVELCGLVANTPEVINSERFLKDIRDREKLMSTGIGLGIAIPHAQTSSVRDFVIAVGRCKRGIDFESLDGKLTYIIILMGAPENKQEEFLELIAKIGAIFNKPGLKESFLDAESPEEMFNLLVKSLN